jgi:hypothetical protein
MCQKDVLFISNNMRKIKNLNKKLLQYLFSIKRRNIILTIIKELKRKHFFAQILMIRNDELSKL